MKQTAIFTPTLSLTLMTTLLVGAVWTASGAPIIKTKPASNAPAQGAPAAHLPQTKTGAGQASTASGAEMGSEFTPSRFPGVAVRHVPSPSVRGTAAGGSQGGMVLKNLRPSPVPQGGMMADIDANSYPSEKANAPKKAAHPKAARKTASRKGCSASAKHHS